MAIIFPCTIHCDAPGCHSSQAAEAVYDSPTIFFFGLPTGGPATPFTVRYDRKSKIDWVMLGEGRMACSPVCVEKVKEAERDRKAEECRKANEAAKQTSSVKTAPTSK